MLRPTVTVASLVTEFQAKAPRLYFASDVDGLCAAILERQEATDDAWAEIERILFLLVEYCPRDQLLEKLRAVMLYLAAHPNPAERRVDCIAPSCGI
jgi:hypothetical protein